MLNKNKNQAVVFDFDGVLVDTFDLNLKVMQKFIEASSDDLKNLHNGNVHERSSLDFTGELGDDFFRLQKENFKEEFFYPVVQSVRFLAEEFRLFINSSSSEDNILDFLRMVKLDDAFEQILGFETAESKIKKFQYIFKNYQLEPANCVFVTDTLGDLMEGNRAGVKNLAVSWGYHQSDRLRMGNPLKIINQPDDLIPAIKELLELKEKE
ncbi:MAG TPA: HAD family hydrolase [Candidatus Moranbacteria bacterium]|nr:HAD family hydrolase [Candidatus Moranbacteria bacterium]